MYPTFRRLGQAPRAAVALALVAGALTLGCSNDPPRGQAPFVPADREAIRHDTARLFAARADAAIADPSTRGTAVADASLHDAAAPRPLPEAHPDPALILRREPFLALREGLLALSKTAPAGYPYWEPIAADGAEAARRSDVAGARASCVACHERHAEHWRRDHPWPPPERADAH